MGTGEQPSGLVWNERFGAWAVVGYAAAEAALVDPHLAAVRDVTVATNTMAAEDAVPSPSEFFGSWFSRSVWHRQVKRPLHKPYSERYLSGLEEMFAEIAVDCAGRLGADGDLMADFLTPFSMRTTTRMLDVPEEQRERLTKVVMVLNTFLNGAAHTEHNLRAVDQCIRYLRALTDLLFALPDPGPTVRALRTVADVPGGGIWLAVATLGQLLTAGFEPMTTGAALACRELYARPDLLVRVRSGQLAIGDVAEEALRLNPPFPYVHRWATQECDCYGQRLTPGTYVVIDLRAVNRDPATFPRPGSFDPGRDRGLNLTFGHGPHYCLGIGMARLQIAAALRALLDIDPPVRVLEAEAVVDDIGYFVTVRELPFQRNQKVGAR